jgi:hypothetical protein
MSIAPSVLIVLTLGFAGVTLHRALAGYLLRRDQGVAGIAEPSERDLLLLGLLPGIAILGTLGTYIALFRLLRPELVAAGLLAALIWRRRDAAATLRAVKALVRDTSWAIFSRNWIAVVALVAFLMVAAALLLRTQIPFDSRDVAVFQLPLARSMVAHHGFIYPQIESLFYSYNPLFFNLVSAEALLYLDREATASVVGVAVFLGYIGALLTFYRRHRAAGLLLALLVLGYSSFFTVLAASPLLDVTRSCFSALALLFGYRYLSSFRLYDVAIAALLAGAAASGHYLELIPATVLGLCLLPQLRRGKQAWIHAGVFIGIFLLVAGFWYVRNWVMTGNPIFPFLFGHPGWTDDQMAEFVYESVVPLHPEDRLYVNDLNTLRGWIDFGLVIFRWFLSILPGALSAALLVLSIILGRARVGMLLVATALLFVLWYAVMFHLRWAMSAFLLFCSTAIIASAPLVDLALSAFSVPDRRRAGQVAIGSIGLAVCVAVGVRAATYGFAFLPSWVDPQLVREVAVGHGVDAYLADRVPGYAIYHLIGSRDLRTVLQPFDNDGPVRAATFNDGKQGGWVLPFEEAPHSAAELRDFLSHHGASYFIDQTNAYPVGNEHMTPDYLVHAHEITDDLRRGATLILSDRFGWSLYALAGSAAP